MHYLGIDVSKSWLDVILVSDESDQPKHRKISNNEDGFKQLLDWLQRLAVQQIHCCLESTGIYGNAIAEFLHGKDLSVSIINPAKISAFAKSMLKRAKSDELDALTIALFCKRMKPNCWRPPSAEIKHLRFLTRRLSDLKDSRQQEKNRLESTEKTYQHHIQRHVESLDEEIDLIESEIKSLVRATPEFKRQVKLLVSIPSVGDHTATVMLAEMGNIVEFKSARRLAAFAGLVPRKETSGSSINRPAKLMKAGNVAMRKALYMPALVASRHNPILKNAYLKLLSHGKCKMSALGALMRRLLHIMYGVLKSNRPFDPNYLTQSS